MSSRTTVVTVTYNSLDVLGPFLRSVRAASAEPCVLVVSDNGSEDLQALDRLVSDAGGLLVSSGANLGYGGGVRYGVDAVDEATDFLLVTNPDVVLAPGSIDVLEAAADRLPEAGALGPRILDESGEVYPSARQLPSLRTGLGHAAFSRLWPANPWSRAYWSVHEADVERSAGWLSGACVLVRRSAWDEVSGFDEGYFMYFEDVDLGARLGRAGWRNVYVPDAVVVHSGAHATSNDSTSMERVHHASAYRYLARKYRGPWLLPLRTLLRLGLKARARWVTRR